MRRIPTTPLALGLILTLALSVAQARGPSRDASNSGASDSPAPRTQTEARFVLDDYGLSDTESGRALPLTLGTGAIEARGVMLVADGHIWVFRDRVLREIDPETMRELRQSSLGPSSTSSADRPTTGPAPGSVAADLAVTRDTVVLRLGATTLRFSRPELTLIDAPGPKAPRPDRPIAKTKQARSATPPPRPPDQGGTGPAASPPRPSAPTDRAEQAPREPARQPRPPPPPPAATDGSPAKPAVPTPPPPPTQTGEQGSERISPTTASARSKPTPPTPPTPSAGRASKPSGAGPVPPSKVRRDAGGGDFNAALTNQTYAVAPGGTSGFIQPWASADLVLGAVAIDHVAGPLAFDRPSGVASNGDWLAVSDRQNHRVLLWKSTPTTGQAPDIVLGQPDMTQNLPGDGRDQLHWPTTVRIADGKLFVADSYNHRVLVWDQMPSDNGAPADRIVGGLGPGRTTHIPGAAPTSVHHIAWPWGLWSDGDALIVSSTATGELHYWAHLPADPAQPADRVVSADGMGTPRGIDRFGDTVVVGDHNAEGDRRGPGTWIWSDFPDGEPTLYQDEAAGLWLEPDFDDSGALWTLEADLRKWSAMPSESASPTRWRLSDYRAGDGATLDISAGGLWIAAANSQRVYGWTTDPMDPSRPPDVVLGGDDAAASRLTNPMPVSDGAHLFVASAFEREVQIWRARPDASGVDADVRLTGVDAHAIAVSGDVLAVGGRFQLALWDGLPLDGQAPTVVYDRAIGDTALNGVSGLAMDERGFYLLDDTGLLSVWPTPPFDGEAPQRTLQLTPGTLSIDAKHIYVSGREGLTRIGRQRLDRSRKVRTETAPWPSSLTGSARAIVGDGQLFVADFERARVLAWRDADAFFADAPPDAELGAGSGHPAGGAAGLTWPRSMSWDGDYLWVGEYKFSGRLLRFSPTTVAQAR